MGATRVPHAEGSGEGTRQRIETVAVVTCCRGGGRWAGDRGWGWGWGRGDVWCPVRIWRSRGCSTHLNHNGRLLRRNLEGNRVCCATNAFLQNWYGVVIAGVYRGAYDRWCAGLVILKRQVELLFAEW